jgi:hypothetical protein
MIRHVPYQSTFFFEESSINVLTEISRSLNCHGVANSASELRIQTR